VVWLLQRYSGYYGWTVLFNNSFSGVQVHASQETAKVSVHEYLYFVVHHFRLLLESDMPFLLLLGLGSYLARPKNPVCMAAALATAAVAAHYLLFPTTEPRQYAPAVLLCLLALLAVVSEVILAAQPPAEVSLPGA
jgi:hypothetical protein